MKEMPKLCAVFPAVGEKQNQFCRELAQKCNAQIEPKETGYGGKEVADYTIQRDPHAVVSDGQSNAVLRYITETDLDGLILFPGYFDRRFYLTGLPILLVDTLPGLQLGFKNAVALAREYGTNFVTATYNSQGTDVSQSVADARATDLTKKVALFDAVRRMKATKIMDVQVRGGGVEPHEHWWRLHQEEYLHELKQSTGIDAEIVDYRDLFRRYQQVEPDEAADIAAQWMQNEEPTNAIKNTRSKDDVTDEEISKAARLYVAANSMMKESQCNAITLDATTWASAVGRDFAQTIGEDYLVSGSLPLMEFRLHGIPACCQSDMEGLVSLVIGESVAQRPGFHGDFVVDPFNEVAQIGHCNAPTNPYGDDRRVPYSIGGEPSRRPQVYVDLPQEGPVTVIKANVLQKKISTWGGSLVPGETIYRNFFQSYCCSKLVARTNAQRIQDNYEYRTFANHNCLFYGDIRDEIKGIASLLGYDVVEQDG